VCITWILIQAIASKWIHPDDLQFAMHFLEKNEIIKKLSHDQTISMICRMIVNGNIEHVRHIIIMCEDKEHILCCLERIEEEIRTKREQEKDIQSAKRMARLDKLTGIRNKNAFIEYTLSINEKLNSGTNSKPFAFVMCDVNDLKLINDTRGHSFGDEAIQRASRMVCDVFKHSPVFRVGGDEFVAVLFDEDYEERESLLHRLKEESLNNKRSRSGPVVACGMAEYDPEKDRKAEDVYERADKQMYIVKKEMKSIHLIDGFSSMDRIGTSISEERKRMLDGMFGALYTIAGGGYVYICDTVPVWQTENMLRSQPEHLY
jgi:diguanylate cyclase (GGDEF)-like protein